jgi:hypothetical protein
VGDDALDVGPVVKKRRKENAQAVAGETDQKDKLYHEPTVLLHERRPSGLFYCIA